MSENLPVLGLTVENIQKIEFADISPNKNMVKISGANGAGKSSLCNGLRLALGDKDLSKLMTKPITNGKDHAQVTVDVGKFKITRTWNSTGKSNLKIESTDKSVFRTPAELLKSMVGNLAFDPLEFSQMPQKEQRDVLLSLIDLGGVDISELDANRKEIYDNRTIVNRAIKQLEGQFNGISNNDLIDVPDERLNSSDVMVEYQDAITIIENNKKLVVGLEKLIEKKSSIEHEIKLLQSQIDSKNELLFELEDEIIIATDDVSEIVNPDIEEIKTRLANIEQINDKVSKKQEKNRLRDQIRDETIKSEQLTDEITNIDKLKSDTIANANMPIVGLSFDDDGVLFNGIPLNQVSTSEALKVGCAIVISAMNQKEGDKIPIIIIKDGSLLDENNLKVLEEIAVKENIQFWIELVSNKEGDGIFIKNGEVIE